VRFAAAVAALVTTAFVVDLLGVAPPGVEGLLIGVAGLAVVGLAPLLAAGVGSIAWAFYTGFTEHAYGRLTLAGGDLERLSVMVFGTVLLAWMVRELSHVLEERRL
jgi:hypothetical protein